MENAFAVWGDETMEPDNPTFFKYVKIREGHIASYLNDTRRQIDRSLAIIITGLYPLNIHESGLISALHKRKNQRPEESEREKQVALGRIADETIRAEIAKIMKIDDL